MFKCGGTGVEGREICCHWLVQFSSSGLGAHSGYSGIGDVLGRTLFLDLISRDDGLMG